MVIKSDGKKYSKDDEARQHCLVGGPNQDQPNKAGCQNNELGCQDVCQNSADEKPLFALE